METIEMYKAIKDKLICLEVKIEKESLIIMPQTTEKPHVFLKIISAGSEVENVKVGDVIAVHNRAGMVMMGLNDEIIRIIKEDEIYCILNMDAVNENL